MNIHRYFAGNPPGARSLWSRVRRMHIPILVIAFLLGALAFFAQPSTLFAQAGAGEVTLTKSNPPPFVESGEPFEFVLDYTCFGQAIGTTCTNVVLTDFLPADMEYLSGSATVNGDIADFTPAGNTLTWTFKPELEAGSSGRLRFWARFKPGTIPGTSASNTAELSSDNNTVEKTTTLATVTGNFQMVAEKTSTESVVDVPTTYSLNVCSPDDVGGVVLTNAVFTDTLPAQAIFVGAQGVEGVDWIYTPAALAPPRGGTLTFIGPHTIPVGGCFTRTLQVVYTDTIALADNVTNHLTVTGTPEGCSPGNLPPHCGGKVTHVLTDEIPVEVIEPYPVIGGSKGSASDPSYTGTEARPGDAVTYTLSASNDGFLPLSNVTVTDTIHADVDVTGITAGGSVTRTVWISSSVDDGLTWTPVPGGPFNDNNVIPFTTSGKDVVTLRWLLVEDLEVFSEPFVVNIYAIVDTDVDPNVVPAPSIPNCSDVATSTDVDGVTSCNTVRVIADRAIPRIAKDRTTSSPTGQHNPNDYLNFSVRLSNADVAQLPLENPVIEDLLPLEFEYVVGSATSITSGGDTFAPTVDIEPISGRTRIRWEWDGGTHNLMPGEALVVGYQVQVIDGTPPGTYINTVGLMDWEGPGNPANGGDPWEIYLCPETSGNDDEYFEGVACQVSLGSDVGVALEMESEKWTRGLYDCSNTTDYGPTTACEDEDFNKLGLTAPGSMVDYRVVLTNASNVSVTNIVLYDIFPAVGDKGVVDLLPRGSQWRPNLQDIVEGESDPPGAPKTIYYSTAAVPCRDELVAVPGCVNDWSTTPPVDITQVTGIKVIFCNADNTNCYALPRKQTLTLSWPMVAPNETDGVQGSNVCMTPPGDDFDSTDPANADCKIAWNSFGFRVSEYRPNDPTGALPLLSTEPIKVGMRLGPRVEGTYALGNFVWLDVAGVENDGLQQDIERLEWGVNGVRVELLDNTGTVLATRFTGDNLDGDAGYYLFTNLPEGDYRVRFYLPPGYQAALQEQGMDDTIDSDGATTGSNGFGTYYETDLITLNDSTTDDNNEDLTWDFGLWKPTDYGDAPNTYPTEWSTGVISEAARHIIYPGMHLGASVDAEGNGQPHDSAWGDDLAGSPDDEDGVRFANYIETLDQPIGVLHAGPGTSNSLVISYTQPVSIPNGYIYVWLDLDGDGVWSASEQVASQAVSSGSGSITLPLSSLPESAADVGKTYMRVRYSSVEDLSFVGTAPDGEVEDYAVMIVRRLNKSLVATSESHTTGSNVTIGEIVRYRLVTQIPEGELTNFTVTDNLPTGLKFLNDGTTKVAFISDGGIASSIGAVSGIPGVQIGGTTVITPNASAVLPGSQIAPLAPAIAFGSGTDPVFTFGTLTNNDNDDDAEYVVIEFNALVLNISGNQNGTNRDNTFSVSYGNYTATSNQVQVTVREPELSITKNVVTSTPLGPGSTITYSLSVAHTANSTLPAIDVVITDVLPVELVGASVVGETPSNLANASISGDFLSTQPFTLALGSGITILISGQLAADVEAGDIITNTGYVAWTSVPGGGTPKDTPGNPTGSETPGDSGDEDGERNGNGTGPNDYRDNDNVVLNVHGDWGDLPPTYPTLAANNGARHTVLGSGNPFLGSLVDVEPNGQPTAAANGDDVNGVDDEDGIVFLTPLIPGRTAQIQVTAGTAGYLSAFIDFDGDGTLDPVTVLSSTGPAGVATGTLGDTQLSTPGVYVLTIDVPANASGVTPARFRYTAESGQGGNSVDGLAASGEVEDYILSALGDFVWHDLDYDGQQDTDEPGVNGVVVNLLDAAGDPVLDGDGVAITTTTGNHPTTGEPGWYQFPGLPPATYQVEFTLPENYVFTLHNVGPDATDSDADRTTGISHPVTLAAGENNQTVDAGLVVPSSLGDHVWHDVNGDGLQDPSDPLEVGVPGVTVTLYLSGTVVPIATTTTDATGTYTFSNLIPDSYYVTFDLDSLPDGYVATTPNVGGDDAIDSDGDPITGSTAPVTLAPGEHNPTLDLGIYKPASLGDHVWIDVNGDGLQDEVDTGVEGVTVRLYISGTTDVVSTTVTGPTGYYTFSNLPPDSYYVTFDLTTLPDGYVATTPNVGGDDAIDSDGDPITGSTAPVTLASGEHNPTLDLGIYKPASLGDHVWIDVNGDGLQDEVDTGVEGVTVRLYISGTTDVVSTTVTGPTGYYTFSNLPPDSYYVTFDLTTLPDGYVATTPNVGGDDAIDSDGDPITGSTAPVTLASGEHNPTLDLGIYKPASLGDHVWIDVNGNGLQDEVDTGVEGVTVRLYISGTTDVVSTTVTGPTGYYTFSNLPPDSYYVTFDLTTLPDGYVATTPNVGGDDGIDSDGDPITGSTAPVTLASGEHNPTLDLGIYKPASLGDHVWIDSNENGIQDLGEVGVAGITVTLHISDTGELIGTTATDANGIYTFSNLIPGSYYVTFDLDSLPEGYRVTRQNEGGDDTIDSDGDPVTGVTAPVTLASGEHNPTLDLGIFQDVALGDFVWIDANADGLQDPTDPLEVGVPGVVVTLHISATGEVISSTVTDDTGHYIFSNLLPGSYYVTFDLTTLPDGYVVTTPNVGSEDAIDSDGDPITGEGQRVTLSSGMVDLTHDLGIYKPASLGDRVWVDTNVNGIQDDGEVGVPGVTVYLLVDGTRVATTTTNVDGFYLFTDLKPGTYGIEFNVDELPADYASYLVTKQNSGEDDGKDSDADRTTGITHVVTLVSGDENLSLDMGIFLPVTVGDRVWYDLNGNGIQDDGEGGVAGVTVRIYDAVTGEPVLDLDNGLPRSATTNADGLYLFEGLPSGDYYVIFDLTTLPDGYGVTSPHQGGDDSLDSDGDPVGRTPNTGLLPPGAQDLTLDLGIAMPVLELSKQAVPTTVKAGDLVTYTLSYSNTGFGAASFVFVEETVPEHTTFVAAGSTPGWSCEDGAVAGTTCIIEVGHLLPQTSGSVTFVVRLNESIPSDFTSLENVAGIGHRPAEEDPKTVTTSDDAKVVVESPTNEAPTEQPEEPAQSGDKRIFLPSIGS